jgi:uncharacterized Fe-S cluster-containing radical SAM superfamily enzyme
MDRPDPPIGIIAEWYRSAFNPQRDCLIQLSGGEPTLRDDLPEIVALGRKQGFGFIQLNSNGIRLAADKTFVQKLAEAGLSTLFLQFDGTHDAVYQQIRGQKLLETKLQAIDNCAANGIGVILVPVLYPGINTGDIGRSFAWPWKNAGSTRRAFSAGQLFRALSSGSRRRRSFDFARTDAGNRKTDGGDVSGQSFPASRL